jgi:putative Mg2+ transporter-C (MgtC) family protein
LETLSDLEVFERILFSLAAGTLIGVEREWNNKPAGVRTYALVCEGSALFMITSLLLGEQVIALNGGNYDPSRIASTVVQGIGFLGGGVIFMRGSRVRGITTASAIWVTAALGLMIGAGFYIPALLGVVSSVFVLVPMRWFEKEMIRSEHRTALPSDDISDEASPR